MRTLRFLGFVIAILFVVGLVHGLISPPFTLWRHHEGWSWWHYLLAPLGIGLTALVAEAVGSVVFAPFFWGTKEHPLWKRAVYVLYVLLAFGLGAAALLSPWWLEKLG